MSRASPYISGVAVCFADQVNGGSIKGMIEAVDLIQRLSGPDTTLVRGHGTLIGKKNLLGYRASPSTFWEGAEAPRRGQGPYDATTLGDTKQSKDRFITEVYDEVKDFPPVVNGERKMPRRTGLGR